MPKRPEKQRKSQAKGLLAKRAVKDGPLNNNLFNFLENLLVFRTMENLSVPAESGVQFRINREATDAGICLLIHIDNQKYPIIEEGVPRPDYVALYLHGDGCICTIIEMKGKEENNLEHGVEQITTLAARLKREFQDHLPRRFRLHMQGILVCPPEAQVPNELIADTSRKGFTIYPARSQHSAEIFPYISKINRLTDRFENNSRSTCDLTPIEELMSQNSLRSRVDDEQSKKRRSDGSKDGLHINYALSENEYATLITHGKKCVFYVKEDGEQHLTRLRNDINANGLAHKFDVEPMPQTQSN